MNGNKATASQELKEMRSFVNEHFSAIRKIFLLLIIYIMQRTFRSILFSCPCLPENMRLYGAKNQSNLANLSLNQNRLEFFLIDGYDPIIWTKNSRFRKTYTLCFIILPAFSLFFIKFCLSHDAWKILTGCCGDRPTEPIMTVRSSRLSIPRLGVEIVDSNVHAIKIPITILEKLNLNAKSVIDLILDCMFPSFVWIIFCLLDGRFFICGFSVAPCDFMNYHSINIRANSQISGWFIVSCVIFILWIVKFTGAIFSPNNFYEDYFVKAYENCEANEIESRIKIKVRGLAKQYVDVFFNLSQNGKGRWWDKLEPVQNLRKVNVKLSTFHLIQEEKEETIHKKDTKF